MEHVQAFINNISFPKSLDEVLYFIDEIGEYNVETVIKGEPVEWTAPKWCKNDDIVFFMHSKTSNYVISSLKKELANSEEMFSKSEYEKIKAGLETGKDLYDKFGGKIFALGRVNGDLIRDDDYAKDNQLHWRGRIYAPIEQITVLDNPIHISQFNSFIQISRQSAITPVFGEKFEQLKKLIKDYNLIPKFLERSQATPFPLSRISKENWLFTANIYRRSFFLEIQFRTFYVDFMLRELGDTKSFYSECPCKKDGMAISYVDNVILLGSKYLPIEIKLNINAEKDIKSQVHKYCHLDELILNSKKNKIADINKICDNYVMIIDTKAIYLYNDNKYEIVNVCLLDDFKIISDIKKAKETLIALINEMS